MSLAFVFSFPPRGFQKKKLESVAWMHGGRGFASRSVVGSGGSGRAGGGGDGGRGAVAVIVIGGGSVTVSSFFMLIVFSSVCRHIRRPWSQDGPKQTRREIMEQQWEINRAGYFVCILS